MMLENELEVELNEIITPELDTDAIVDRIASGENIDNINDDIFSESVVDSATENETNVLDENVAENEIDKEAEKNTYTQADIEHYVNAEKEQHNNTLTMLSNLLGVDISEVEDTIKEQLYQKQAEDEGVSDTALYAEKKRLEEENKRLTTQATAQTFRTYFISDIETQNKELNIDLNGAVDNPQFVDILSMFYKNPATKDNALKLAHNAVFTDEAIKTQVKTEKEKVINSIKAGQNRAVEGAINSSGGNETKINVAKMPDDEFENMIKRAKNGERIVL